MGEISLVVRDNVFGRAYVVVIHGRCKGAEVLRSRSLIIGDRCCIIIYRFRGIMNGKLRRSIIDSLPLACTWWYGDYATAFRARYTFVINNNKQKNPYPIRYCNTCTQSDSLLTNLINIFNCVKCVTEIGYSVWRERYSPSRSFTNFVQKDALRYTAFIFSIFIFRHPAVNEGASDRRSPCGRRKITVLPHTWHCTRFHGHRGRSFT